ncbi:hypothetical protein ACH5RR_014394 [Cinchona calisaya]|uniref:Uncharacterized protein n=1 Tax=Cinchona calisaya TaxID=153742 RepID=A0ABD3A6C9_9GENT
MAATANTIYSAAFSICRTVSSPPLSRLPPQFFQFRNPNASVATPLLSTSNCSSILRELPRTRKLRSFVASAEEEAPEEVGPEGDDASSTPPPAATTDQTVSVTVSPSDVLTMFFQAEGTMNETVIPTVSKALEETEGIADLKVQVLEGIASVELTKQTTVQATGVASSLVELIQSVRPELGNAWNAPLSAFVRGQEELKGFSI